MSKPGVTVNAPKNFDVKVSRDKVTVTNRDMVELSKDGIRVIIYKDQIDDFKLHGWKTLEDKRIEAEKKIEEAKKVAVHV